ncbi:hypothetical protein H072_9141 [Dactylellina haptotyla CBS 200.50]|uniref:Crossover junction endonuclease MUS81 n=1 Tax=Dactylellina haptotyla (strain CBS 200.50) TaxID=1284197 RepID=S8A391_DACHA|nr:hypothetical protein H072_9141 [Dactylellina haptotyla CBS 200.50]
MPPTQLPCGNPVLLELLEQWTQDSRGTERERTYRRAADSMRACPFTFAHPSEAKNLIGIGDKIADRLTKKFIEYKRSRGETPPPLVPSAKPQPVKGKKRKSGDLDDIDAEEGGTSNTNGVGLVAGEDRESLFDSGEPSLGRWDRARAPKKKKAASKNAATLDEGDGEDGGEQQPAKKPRKPRAPKQYVPRPRTGGYAILLALSELEPGDTITKDELVRRAQPYCDTSFTLAGNAGENHKYTGWSGLKTLKEHNLVTQKGRPALFCLTEWGWDVAEKMVEVETELGGVNVVVNAVVAASNGAKKSRAKGKTSTDDDYTADRSLASAIEAANAFSERRLAQTSTNLGDDEDDVLDSLPQQNRHPLPPRPRFRSASAQPVSNAPPDIKTPFTPRYLKAGTFSVHLVLDNREVASKTDRDYIQRSFENVNCTPLTRGMELGDVMWIAKGKLYENGRETTEEVEVSIDYVCERKRLDDLIGSIKDGRFHEQKFRLKKFVGNTTYIIELPNGKITASTAAMAEAITTAIYSTQVVNGFFVKLSPKLDDTVRYLARFTRLLATMFEGKDLYVYPDNLVQVRTFSELKSYLLEKEPGRQYFLNYSTLAAMASKSRTSTLRDVYLKMLMCTRGVSAEKALEIQRHFKTPRELLERYEKCGGEAVGKAMIMGAVDTSARTDRRKVKGALSAKIWEVWGQ